MLVATRQKHNPVLALLILLSPHRRCKCVGKQKIKLAERRVQRVTIHIKMESTQKHGTSLIANDLIGGVGDIEFPGKTLQRERTGRGSKPGPSPPEGVCVPEQIRGMLKYVQMATANCYISTLHFKCLNRRAKGSPDLSYRVEGCEVCALEEKLEHLHWWSPSLHRRSRLSCDQQCLQVRHLYDFHNDITLRSLHDCCDLTHLGSWENPSISPVSKLQPCC